nr:immunoglobulin heavy chain junction region [Macaca mulatta]
CSRGDPTYSGNSRPFDFW